MTPTDIALLFLRFFVGVSFIIHGWPKLRNWKQTFNWLWKSKIPLPFLGTNGLIIAEVFGGVFLILGIGVRIVALILAFVMLVAVSYKWQQTKKYVQETELPLAFFVMLIVLLIAGGGAWQLVP